jgi:hypothetical protein
MKIVSVNIGMPREVKWHADSTVYGGAYKDSVKNPVKSPRSQPRG